MRACNKGGVKVVRKRKIEWSKFFTFVVCIVCGVYAIWSGYKYYELCQLAIELNTMMPDASLPITGITGLLGSILGYLTYQGVLKNSLNKNGLTKLSSGIITSIRENDLEGMVDNAPDLEDYH